ncbi:MAG: pyruvate kinase [Clostridia bacterium]|nr:pyruvate kinase [Clostridia bacterium]
MRKTKIICTIGPATDNPEVLKSMIKSGMDVARLNFSHGSYEDHKMRMDEVKKVREELKRFVPIMLDTKGPEIRTGSLKDGMAKIKAGQKFVLTTENIEGDNERVSVTYKNLPGELRKGDIVLIDDGLLKLEVVELTENEVICISDNDAVLGNKKGINLPNITVDMPYVSEKDRNDLLFGIKEDIDFVAASFVRSASDIYEIRKILEQNGGKHIKIIAKIENRDGVKNIDEILKASDGIMVARGDMGVEIPMEELPGIQKMLIRKCFLMGKIAITATQMLESMITKPRPTRAEISDVANAVYDGTSATMLSGESAIGAYPVEAVKAMARIVLKTESAIDYKTMLKDAQMSRNVTGAVSHAACTMAQDMEASAIVTVTKSGHTARMISKYRPESPIIAAAVEERVARQLAMSWGVVPVKAEAKATSDELFDHAIDLARDTGIVDSGDVVVITGGVPIGVSGTTNIVKVEIVGHVLCQGNGVNHCAASGNLCVAEDESEARANFKEGNILVIRETTNEMLDILKKCSGIITEADGSASHAAIVGMTLDIPVVTGVTNATAILKSGTVATIDGYRGIVYNGITKVM